MEYFGLIELIGQALSPMMQMVGLPGKLGIVWASTMISNIYGGMLTFYNLAPSMHLSQAQVTTMCILMLVAHTLPVELSVAQKAGVKLFTMFLIRFGFAFLAAFTFNGICTLFDFYQAPAHTSQILASPETSADIFIWITAEVKRYGVIVFYIFCLLCLMRFLKYIGFITLITKILKPILGVLGIGKEVIPITVIGSTLGILYGGALIINETKTKQLQKMDIFYALTLMGLCHSLIEDSLLMLSLGASWTGVFVFRMIFAFAITFLIVLVARKLPVKWQGRLLVNQK